MELSQDAKTALGNINHLEHKKILPTVEAIHSEGGWTEQVKDDQGLIILLDQLMERKLIVCDGATYSLTKQGFARAKQIMSDDFGDWMVACEKSRSYRKFCEQVYGIDLCQVNMADKAQLEKLLEVMNLGKDDPVLDLGCGVGLIAEYISDVTEANIMGIDFAAQAIERAMERTGAKKDRLSFQVMDMDNLSLPDQGFSGVISIDTLYFVKDLQRTIQAAKKCLRENGQMGIFFTTKIPAGETKDSLAPDQTPLAKALQECGLNFQTWDFTQEERKVWEKNLQVVEEIKQEFEAEGNLSIYEGAVAEAKFNLEYFKTGTISRYLYHIR